MSDLSRMLDDVYAMPEADDIATDTFPVDDLTTDGFPVDDFATDNVGTDDGLPIDGLPIDGLPIDDFATDNLGPDDFATKAPSWSSSDALDEAFSSWVPGPVDGSSALERSMVDESVEMSFVTEPEVEQWLDETEPVAPAPIIAGPRRWSPSDDDILPSRRGPGRRRR